MNDQIKVLLKSLTKDKDTLKAIWKLVYTTIGYTSSIFSIAVLSNDLTGNDIFIKCIKDNWITTICIIFMFSCILHREKTNFCKNISNRDMQIEISTKNIFSNKHVNSFVIPTNTLFRTKMEKEYISSNSVQGCFQLKYFKNNLDQLDKLIHESLINQGINGLDVEDCFGVTKKYPVGTVAKIDYEGKHFYFVAVNDVNETGKPIDQDIKNISIALQSLANTIKSIGHYDDLCIPLIGSGKAAIANATRKIVFKNIVDFFLQSEDKLVSKLIISIHPKDYINNKIDLTQAEKYIDFKCDE